MPAHLRGWYACSAGMPVTVGDLPMIEMDRIQETVAHIVREFSPHKVILFGSGASGRPTADPDVDLLVILPFAGHHTRKAVEILERVDPPFRIDLLVRTPDQVRQRLEWNDFVLREILEQGRVLYAAPDGRVGGQGGRQLEIGAARTART